jgi:hypothetical protein
VGARFEFEKGNCFFLQHWVLPTQNVAVAFPFFLKHILIVAAINGLV